MKKLKYYQIALILLIAVWFIFLSAAKINLVNTDIGRHLKNGEYIFKNKEVLYTNFYSYTFPNFPFINHHWASGLIFFAIQKLTGFTGLSIFYVVLYLLTLFIFIFIAQKESNLNIALISASFTIPLIAQRNEIRPEIFSYLFAGIFWLICFSYKKQVIKSKWLILLPILQALWVNLHIYFFVGFIIVGAFFIEDIINAFIKNRKEEIKNWILILIAMIIATFLNPSFIKGALYPLQIFNNYNYKVVENQSLFFLEKQISLPTANTFKISLFILAISFIILFLFNRKRISFSYLTLSLFASLSALLAIRNFALFGLFAIPAMSYNIKELLLEKLKLKEESMLLIVLIVFITINIASLPLLFLQAHNFGFGLEKTVNWSAYFFKNEKIKGPIFNNYDIGGYLIYHLFPEEKVFVDNRPEAYPGYFFDQTYIPLQENEKVWQEKSKEYNFNAIFFYYKDITPWAQKFLIERISDPSWAPVFVDNYSIIFVKRNEINKSIIEKYEIPKSYFSIIKTN